MLSIHGTRVIFSLYHKMLPDYLAHNSTLETKPNTSFGIWNPHQDWQLFVTSALFYFSWVGPRLPHFVVRSIHLYHLSSAADQMSAWDQ